MSISVHILERLCAAEGLEKYLHTRYVGQKRFSGEGGESIIPLLDNLLQRAGKSESTGSSYWDGTSRATQCASKYFR